MIHSSLLAGKNVVISGKFIDHTRDELKELIELHGGKNQSGVGANTAFIVAGENMGPAKLQKAQKLGISILSEAEFVALIAEESDSESVAENAKNEPQNEPQPTQKEPSQTVQQPVQGTLF